MSSKNGAGDEPPPTMSREMQRKYLLQNRRLGAIHYRLQALWGEKHQIVTFYTRAIDAKPDLARELAKQSTEQAVQYIRSMYLLHLKEETKRLEELRERERKLQQEHASGETESRVVARESLSKPSADVRAAVASVASAEQPVALSEERGPREISSLAADEWAYMLALQDKIAAREDEQVREVLKKRTDEYRSALEEQIVRREQAAIMKKRNKLAERRWISDSIEEIRRQDQRKREDQKMHRQLALKERSRALEAKHELEMAQKEERMREELAYAETLERQQINHIKKELQKKRMQKEMMNDIVEQNRLHEIEKQKHVEAEKEETAKLMKLFEQVQAEQEKRRQLQLEAIKKKVQLSERLGGAVVELEKKHIEEENRKLLAYQKAQAERLAQKEEEKARLRQKQIQETLSVLDSQVIAKQNAEKQFEEQRRKELEQLKLAMQMEKLQQHEAILADYSKRSAYRNALDGQVHDRSNRPQDMLQQMTEEERKMNSRYLNSPSIDTLSIPLQNKPFVLQPPRKRVDPLYLRALEEDAAEQELLQKQQGTGPLAKTVSKSSPPQPSSSTRNSRHSSSNSLDRWEAEQKANAKIPVVRPPFGVYEDIRPSNASNAFQDAALQQIFPY